MSNKFSRIELGCAIAFFICAVLCIIWFFVYAYFAVPEIVLNGNSDIIIKLGESYEEFGAVAILDNKDISDRIKIDNPVDTNKVGNYIVKYSVTNNKNRQKQTVSRRVKVREGEKPVVTLKGGSSITAQFGHDYKDPGYTAKDNYDGDITDKVEIQGIVDTKTIGTYKLYYTSVDSSENSSTAVRTVKVVDTEAPKITLNGKNYTTIKLGGPYNEEGFKAVDNYDGDISNKVKTSGKVNVKLAGYYKLTYSVTDSFGNTAKVTRTVQVGSQADIDNANYIYVSIADQKLWFYKNGVLQISSSVVTGLRGVHDTPRGSFRILGKAQSTYLVGDDYKTFVNYWMPIYYGDGIGLHDATWRSSFGGTIYKTSGSHGCVNLPYYVAEYIYYNAPIGIAVRIV